jgi:hypothetical protein
MGMKFWVRVLSTFFTTFRFSELFDSDIDNVIQLCIALKSRPFKLLIPLKCEKAWRKNKYTKPGDFYKFTKILPGQNRCMVVLALTYPKFTVVFFLWFFIPALSIQFMNIGDISVTGIVHVGHSSACRSTYVFWYLIPLIRITFSIRLCAFFSPPF